MAREDGRTPSQMRPTRIVRNYTKHPEGSVLIAVGDTKVVLYGIGGGVTTALHA